MTWKDHLAAAAIAFALVVATSFGFIAGYHHLYTKPMNESIIKSIMTVHNRANTLDTRIDSLENDLAYVTRSAKMSDYMLVQFLEALAKHTQEQDVRLDTYEKRYLDLLRAMPFYHKESTAVDPEAMLEAEEQIEKVLKWNERSDAE